MYTRRQTDQQRLRLYLSSGTGMATNSVVIATALGHVAKLSLRGELGISRPLWGEACLAMGRECAAVAVALVSARPAEHFRTSPGGYSHGMVAKAKAGELNLVRTIWGLRQAKATRPRSAPVKAGGMTPPQLMH